MPQTAPWNLRQLSLSLVLDGQAVPITAVRCQYELNSLPHAVVSIPTGRDLRTLRPAGVPATFDGGQVVPATVIAEVVYAAGSDQAKAFGLPASGPFTLFDGYLDWAGYSRGENHSATELHLRHWLSDLNFSSIYSRYSHPTNPAQYSAAAILPSDATGAPIYGQAYDDGHNLTAANIQSDIWAKALQPYFVRLCRVEGLRIAEQNVAPAGADNSEAATALGKVVSYPSLGLAPLVVDSVATLMHDQLQDQLRNNAMLASHTIWDVLIGGLAPEYGFSVVPRVSDALVVPFIPTLKTPWVSIEADEYVTADIQGAIPRPLRAVGLIAGLQFETGADARPPGPDTVGGWYENPAMAKGMILITRGPRWSERLPGMSAAQRDAAVGRGGKPVAVAADPAAAGPPDPGVRAAVAAGQAASNNVLDALAQARYAHELDRAKQGFVAGPLRLDIAPGSIVAVRPDGQQWLNAGQQTSFVGAVARVAIALDAQAMAGGTSFHLTHVRTSAEQAAAGRTVAAHPLFAKSFSGAGLLDNPAPAG